MPTPQRQIAPEVADLDAHRLLRQVGGRVRAARQRAGQSRRTLSEASGVSPRYLAQLEAGEGNISIALLQRVAAALAVRIEEFLCSDDGPAAEAAAMAQRYLSADQATQARVRRMLEPEQVHASRQRRICLIGLRGAGKSTLGAMLGQSLGLPFVELNRQIENRADMPLAEILALYGPEGYRRLEADALDEVISEHNAVVLAVAGGIVTEADTYATLLARFHAIWIKAQPQEHMARVRAQGDTRPMKGNPEAMAQLRAILRAREELYARAGLHLDTSGKSVERSAQDLSALVGDLGIGVGA